ncbi:hypothetical protein HN992_00790 [Candidatus Woesearchaeota archaeon]|jgi:hypothetical protein|nr:hypothetical protein [Candidatus Woesearchaeota archaeon]MBT3439080.1 hypothetical protein [Candidatus Woesearchaeota archaeon]MBT4058674.1 hypothetical protein [Candidatus Woesearchaeota archaeon]MBT4206882.1 hypothetical protein [Candidatus Woesearchaeota archaeon]MBT4731757.1 hypothetical protein [Candidatus Woesearchaeota archaeon]
MIELGGNIKLKGFSEIDNASLIVIKKIVGNYAKKLAETTDDFQNLILSLESKTPKDFKINIEFQKTSENLNSEIQGENLFFTLSKALEGIKTKKE